MGKLIGRLKLKGEAGGNVTIQHNIYNKHLRQMSSTASNSRL
jgi:hypothetical protein